MEMIPGNAMRALIANDPRPDREGDRAKSRVAEIWFAPEDEEEVSDSMITHFGCD